MGLKPPRLLIDQLNKHKVDVVAVQKIQWIGIETTERHDCTVMYSHHVKKKKHTCTRTHMRAHTHIYMQRDLL
jgi:hypothetical protein